jgi:hypothetical protein
MSKTLVIVVKLVPPAVEVLTIFGLKYFGWDSYAALFCGIIAFFIFSPIVGVILIMASAPLQPTGNFGPRGFRSAVRIYLKGLQDPR